MQKQNMGILEALFWGVYSLFIFGIFGVLIYVFWQNGLFTSWLSGLGYIVLAFLITAVINALLVMVYFAFSFFSRLFDAIVDFTFPSTTKPLK